MLKLYNVLGYTLLLTELLFHSFNQCTRFFFLKKKIIIIISKSIPQIKTIGLDPIKRQLRPRWHHK
jgi:hypothetical protein